MPTLDEEVEQVMKRSEELAAQFEELEKRALDPSRQLGPLFEALEENFAKMAEVLQVQNAPPGTGVACLETAMEWIGDFAEFEALALKSMYGGRTDAKPASSTVRPGMRRGMRI